MYISGEPLPLKKVLVEKKDVMQIFTISNVEDTHWKLYFCFFYAIIIVTVLILFIIVQYMKKFKSDPDFIALQSNY